jgi:hypothetical protein
VLSREDIQEWDRWDRQVLSREDIQEYRQVSSREDIQEWDRWDKQELGSCHSPMSDLSHMGEDASRVYAAPYEMKKSLMSWKNAYFRNGSFHLLSLRNTF